MDPLPLFTFFSQQAFLGLNPLVYTAYLIANTIVSLIRTAAPTLAKLKEVLVKAGFSKIKDAVVERIWEEAQKGVDSLAEWIRNQKKDDEVSETTAQIVATQAPMIGETLDKAENDPKKKKEAAKKVRSGLKKMGSSTTLLADELAAALLDPTRRNSLVETFQKLLTSEVTLNAEAVKKSSIRKVRQKSQGGGVKITANLKAKDGSTIEDIEQSSSTG
jgi:hypothetical protein